jgi:hypothetical protein
MKRFARTVVIAVLCVHCPSLVGAQPILSIAPVNLVFDSVAVGGSANATVIVHNAGSTAATVTSVVPVSGNSELTASPASFEIEAGQNFVATLTFSPTFAGDVSDGFRFVSDAAVAGSTAPFMILPVSATATGPRITLSETSLTFQSLALNSPVSDTLIIGNTGTEPLDVLSFVITSGAFSVNVPALQVARNDTQSVVVTYAPGSSPAVIDTLTILSNSPGQNLIFVPLDAAETPTDARSARITLVQTEGSGSPVPGDTIRVALFVSPGQDTIRGVEVFLGFDNTRLQTLGVDGPFERTGLTEGIDFQVNEIEGIGSADASAHFSVFFAQEQGSADTLVVVRFVPIEKIQEKAMIRVLSESSHRNSNFLSPGNFSFGIPGANALTLANSGPTVTPFSVIAFDEDTELTIDLTGLAVDSETAEPDLVWRFEDDDSLFAFLVGTFPDELSARITPPENAFGVFALLAIVSDAGGASDTAVVILDIKPTNDPPEIPVYIGPDDNSEELSSSVELTWSGMDREGDAVTFEVQMGTTSTNIPIVANNLSNSSFLAEGLGASKTYFWMIVTVDAWGARTPGPIRRFSTAAPDETPPLFVTGPDASGETSSGALIVWDTDETATSVVRVGLSENLADSSDYDSFGSDTILVLRHEVAVSELAPAKTYFYRVSSRDLFGNISISPIESFTTLEPELKFGDFDGNFIVEFSDFLIFANTFNTSTGDTAFDERADFDSSGTIDFSDFLSFTQVFGTTLTKRIAF